MHRLAGTVEDCDSGSPAAAVTDDFGELREPKGRPRFFPLPAAPPAGPSPARLFCNRNSSISERGAEKTTQLAPWKRSERQRKKSC